MSSGPFVRSKYEADSGDIHPIRVQPETITATGAAPTGAINNDVSAQVGGSRRTYGLHARGIRLVRTIGTGDDTASRYNFLPVLTEAAYDAFNKGQTLTYNTFTWTISDKVPERVK